MMYSVESPWHRLGTKVEGLATAAEALTAASLDWEVVKVPLYVKPHRNYQVVEKKFGIVRFDPHRPKHSPLLGLVGRSYVPLQNSEVFAWFDDIVGQGAAVYETAGALGVGERVWILAKLPDQIRVVGDDVADKYLLLSNSHDGSSGVQVKFTPIRVVCQNTLTMALSDGRGISVHHKASMDRRLKLAQSNLGIIKERFGEIEEGFKRMQKVQMTADRLDEYAKKVFPDPVEEEGDSALNRVLQARRGVAELFEVGRGNDWPGVKGTLWAAYNGVTQFIDYRLGPRTDAGGRLGSICFGTGYLAKARAYRVGLERAKVWQN